MEAHEEVSVTAEAEEEEALAIVVASEAVVVAEAVIEAEEEAEVEEEEAEALEAAEVLEEELVPKVQSQSSSHMRDSQGCTSTKEKIFAL